ncbi:MAG: cyanophycin synthetase, partial [Bacteroidia bacterium]
PELNYFDAHLLGTSSFYSVFEYFDESHGMEAAQIASSLLESILLGGNYADLSFDIERLKDICAHHVNGPSTTEIVNEAIKRNIPVKNMANDAFILLGQGIYQRKIRASISGDTAHIAVNVAGDKSLAKELLANAMLPVPRGVIVTKEEELEQAMNDLGFPLATKPNNGHQGKCVNTNINRIEELREGFHLAKNYTKNVIVEQHIKGNDFRFLVINYKLVAAAKRLPAQVTGDGKSTIQGLIDIVNKDPRRGKGHNSVLTLIEVNETTERLLARYNRTLDTILEKGEIQILKDTANLSTGGTAIDVTEEVHPENILFAERAARVIGLDICGIDIIAPDVKTPFNENGAAILEVNAAPGLRMHFAPSVGQPRHVGKAIVDMMFPHNNGRIPIVAITGTNGKTTTSRLMAHVTQLNGHSTGLTVTDGIYINGKQVVKGDCSGPKSTSVVLEDRSVNFAVLECARGGIIRSGLAFDQCDIGIVTNVAADHLGLNDIYTVEEMARVKEVVPQSVKKEGYAILNASIDLVYQMKDGLQCKVALFSLNRNSNIDEHCKSGGLAAFRNNENKIVILDKQKEIVIDDVKNIPITMEGKAGFMIENILPVVLASYILKFSPDKIREALASFYPTTENTPGRLNFIDVNGVHVIVDYAHNPHSIIAFSEIMAHIKENKTGIITGVGDRRDEDIVEVGKLASEIYDEIIIRVDKDTRRRSSEEIIELLSKGIKSGKKNVPFLVIPDIRDALLYAIEHATPGSYIVLNCEKVDKTLAMVKELKEEFESIHK